MAAQHGLLQIRDHIRILLIIPEAILRVVVIIRGEANLHQAILHRLRSTDLIHTKAQEAIQFLLEAAWRDQEVILQVHMEVLPLLAAAGHLHLTAEAQNQEVHTHLDLPLQVLHQVVVLLQVVVVLLLVEDSIKQLDRSIAVHSK